MSTAEQARFDQTRETLGKLNLEKPCKEMCKKIRRQRIEVPVKIRQGRKRIFGRMCKKTCMTKAKEKISRSISAMKRMKKERKKCKKILKRI